MARALAVTPGPWSAEAAAWLEPVLGTGELTALAEAVGDGRATLCTVHAEGTACAAFVMQLRGEDLCVIAMGGRLPGVDLTASLLPQVEAWGRSNGAARVRIHAGRPGMVERLRGLGYRELEATFVKRVDPDVRQ